VAHALGCTIDTLRVNVVVDPCTVEPPDSTVADTLIVPNIFSPNDDGVNDAITLESPSDEPLTWNIWNRWGQLVYTMSANVVKWDGRNALTGEALPEGVYFIELSGAWDDGSALALQGYVQLVR
jgi:gliding motility-associated-like protein